MIKFQVSKVEKATELLSEISFGTRESEFNQIMERVEGYPKDKEDLIMVDFKHTFIGTIGKAFNEHYPLVLSPDMIWLLIAQGFANHINLNAEKLRHLFVAREGKEKLNVRRDDFIKGENNDWANVFPEFVAQIKQNVKTDVHEVVATSFSTTTLTEKSVFELTLMDSMSAYFEYIVWTRCGIPEITLLGTEADWQKIIDHAKKLAQYDLQWWIEPILPILEKIKETVQGNINQEFWQSMFKYQSMSGSPKMSGWLVYFFPYTEWKISGRNEREISERRKHILEDKNIKSFAQRQVIEESFIFEIHTVKNQNFTDFYSIEQEQWKNPTLEFDNLPQGTTSTPFIWKYFSMEFQMEFIAGFIGVSQDEKTLALKPEIAWAVAEK